jgi:hypothetical protein
MPKKKQKPLHELTSEEAIERLFPKKVIKSIKQEIGNPDDHDQDGRSSSQRHPKA